MRSNRHSVGLYDILGEPFPKFPYFIHCNRKIRWSLDRYVFVMSGLVLSRILVLSDCFIMMKRIK
jgi:hypothetical protein